MFHFVMRSLSLLKAVDVTGMSTTTGLFQKLDGTTGDRIPKVPSLYIRLGFKMHLLLYVTLLSFTATSHSSSSHISRVAPRPPNM